MRKPITEKTWLLALKYFGAHAIKTARKSGDGVERLRSEGVQASRMFTSLEEIVAGTGWHYVNTSKGEVLAYGLDCEGHLDFSQPLFVVSLQRLAEAVFVDYVQMEMWL